MPPEFMNGLIIILAVIAAIIVFVLLFKKIIKTFIALALIAVIVFGCYTGLQMIDKNTNLRPRIPQIDAAFNILMENDEYNIKSIQANHLGNNTGVNIIYQVESSSHNLVTKTLLEETRKIIFDKDIFDSISSLYEESGYPSLFLVGIKYEGIEIQYYKASLKENPSGDPEQMYSDFELIIDTGSIKDSLIPKSLALN